MMARTMLAPSSRLPPYTETYHTWEGSHVTEYVSHVIAYVSHVTEYVSHMIAYVSHVTDYVSHVIAYARHVTEC